MATHVTNRRSILNDQSRDDVTVSLQRCLADLIDLTLQCKQAHWNLVGRRFHSFHLQLDEIVDSAREAADDVAERIATLGQAADGRASTIASQSNLDAFPEGRCEVDEAITLIADRLHTTINVLREGIQRLAEPDPVSQDLLIGISAKLEKHLWMVQSQEE